MDLWQLKIFCKVVELESFSKAGQVIHLSQPTVSSHIKDLEQYFGCPLIDRLTRRAAPTKAGELLYSFALRHLALRKETEMAMAEFQGHYKGRLQIGGSTIPGGYLLPKLIGRFNQSYPDIRISLVIGGSEEIVRKTQNGAIEIGVVGARFSTIQLNQTVLTNDTLKLIVPQNHRWSARSSISVEDLREEPMIVREAGSGTLDTIKKAFRARGLEFDDQFHIVAEIGNTAGVVGGIKSGLGVSILSVRAIEDELTNKKMGALEIEGIDLQRQFYLISDPRRTLSPLARAFWEHILKKRTR